MISSTEQRHVEVALVQLHQPRRGALDREEVAGPPVTQGVAVVEDDAQFGLQVVVV